MSRKYQQITYHANLNVNLTVKNLIQIKSGITINVDASVKIKKNIVFAKKNYIQYPATSLRKLFSKYYSGISAYFNEVLEETKTASANFNEKK